MSHDGVTISQYDSVRERAEALGCNMPNGITILPRNFDSAATREQLEHEGSVVAIRKLWRAAGVVESRLESEGERFGYVQEQALTWVGPTIFVAASLWSHNPELVSIALNVVSNYATDFFKGISGPTRARLAVVGEGSDGTCKRVDYDGPAEGIADLTKLVQAVFKGE